MQAALKLRAKVRRMGNTESVQILKAQNVKCPLRAEHQPNSIGPKRSVRSRIFLVSRNPWRAPWLAWTPATRRNQADRDPAMVGWFEGKQTERVPLGTCWRGKPFYRGAAKNSSRQEWREASNAGRNARAGRKKDSDWEEMRRRRRGSASWEKEEGFSRKFGPHLSFGLPTPHIAAHNFSTWQHWAPFAAC
jgi:hypothetical protein